MDDKIVTSAELAEAAALPRRLDIHTEAEDSGGKTPETVLSKTPVEQKSPARWAHERLVLYIKNFEDSLDNEHEAAMGFVGGEAGILRIEGLGYFDPDIVTFYGTDASGSKTQLIQHVTQLNVMLRAMPKAVKADAPRRIGFRLAQALED